VRIDPNSRFAKFLEFSILASQSSPIRRITKHRSISKNSVTLPQKLANIRLPNEKSHCQMTRAILEILMRNFGFLFSFPFSMNDAPMTAIAQLQIAMKQDHNRDEKSRNAIAHRRLAICESDDRAGNIRK
jgi:hypothetical protein